MDDLQDMWFAVGINILDEDIVKLTIQDTKAEALRRGRELADQLTNGKDFFVKAFNFVDTEMCHEFDAWMVEMRIPKNIRYEVFPRRVSGIAWKNQ